MRISEYQKAADTTDVSSRAPWVGLNQNLFGLLEKVGGISGAMKRRMRDKGSYSVPSFREDVERLIGEALWYLAAVCTHFHLDLEAIAQKNLTENRKRWGQHRDQQGNLFHGRSDGKYSESERFPQKITVEFSSSDSEQSVEWLSRTEVKIDGLRFGDVIDDNVRVEDGYRFHDALHFAFAAHLEWSPVVRALLSIKRKSDVETDKVEDGARARDTEEAVSNFIHHEARKNNYFENAKHVDTEFLIKIQALVIDLEVRDRTLSEWERCILNAYDVIRELRLKNGGAVDVFIHEGRIEYRSTEA